MMEFLQVKEKFVKLDTKTKFFLFIGMVLIAAAVPETVILFIAGLILLYVKDLRSGFFYIFSTAFRFILGVVLLLLALYVTMLVVVYFFTSLTN